MNLDKLKALIRLANNNPNENEANLAARRVCKQLAENNFGLLQPQPRTAASKVNEAKTYSEVHRSPEPFWRAGDPFYDFFTKGQWARPGFNPKTGKNWTDSAPHVDAPEEDYWPYTDTPKPPKRDKQEDYDWVTGKRKGRQELRVCSKCGLETMTFRTDEVPWICNPCHWKENK